MLRPLALTAALTAACIAPRNGGDPLTASVEAPLAPVLVEPPVEPMVELLGGVARMYVHDPEAHSLSLLTGEPGGVLEGNGIFNHDSHLRFAHDASWFEVGVQAGQDGALLDLGTASHMSSAYGYEETIGAGEGFASLRWQDQQLWISGPTGNRAAVQPVLGQERLFETDPAAGTERAWIQLGHTYVARIWSRNDPDFVLVTKFKVIEHHPGMATTVRWEVLHHVPEA